MKRPSPHTISYKSPTYAEKSTERIAIPQWRPGESLTREFPITGDLLESRQIQGCDWRFGRSDGEELSVKNAPLRYETKDVCE